MLVVAIAAAAAGAAPPAATDAAPPAAAGAPPPAACPPPGLDSVPGFDLAAFIAAPWYALAQVPVNFQRPDSFYCVRARYVPVDPSDLSRGLDVLNYANVGGVNGRAVGVSGAAGNTSFALFALPAPGSGPTAASKLLVGPKPLLARAPAAAVASQLRAPNGNYRVVAVGPSSDARLGYKWAIILGGAATPSEPAAGGLCGPSAAKDEGLWLFHRDPRAPAAAVAAMTARAAALGIDTSRLQPVEQRGCRYEGADPPRAAPAPAAAPAPPPSGRPAARQRQQRQQAGSSGGQQRRQRPAMPRRARAACLLLLALAARSCGARVVQLVAENLSPFVSTDPNEAKYIVALFDDGAAAPAPPAARAARAPQRRRREMTARRPRRPRRALAAAEAADVVPAVPASRSMVMADAQGKRFNCSVPTSHAGVALAQPGAETSPPTLKTPFELLESLSALCLYRQDGLWTYEVCHRKHVRQFRQVSGGGGGAGRSITVSGSSAAGLLDAVLAGDAAKLLGAVLAGGDEAGKKAEDFSCGQYAGDAAQSEDVLEDVSSSGHPVKYVRHTFAGGATCVLTGAPRTAEVRYTCARDARENVVLSVREFPTCNYVVLVSTPFLCKHPAFVPQPEDVRLVSCVPLEHGGGGPGAARQPQPAARGGGAGAKAAAAQAAGSPPSDAGGRAFDLGALAASLGLAPELLEVVDGAGGAPGEEDEEGSYDDAYAEGDEAQRDGGRDELSRGRDEHPPAAWASTSRLRMGAEAHAQGGADGAAKGALSEDFLMYSYKVAFCARRYPHDWASCPCGHKGERAARRDPRVHPYDAIACSFAKQRQTCPRGDACTHAHNLFEYWLHPQRYRTELCSFGSNCERPVCFFAHTIDELRQLDPGLPPAETCWSAGAAVSRARPAAAHGACAVQQPAGALAAAAAAAAQQQAQQQHPAYAQHHPAYAHGGTYMPAAVSMPPGGAFYVPQLPGGVMLVPQQQGGGASLHRQLLMLGGGGGGFAPLSGQLPHAGMTAAAGQHLLAGLPAASAGPGAQQLAGAASPTAGLGPLPGLAWHSAGGGPPGQSKLGALGQPGGALGWGGMAAPPADAMSDCSSWSNISVTTDSSMGLACTALGGALGGTPASSQGLAARPLGAVGAPSSSPLSPVAYDACALAGPGLASFTASSGSRLHMAQQGERLDGLVPAGALPYGGPLPGVHLRQGFV
ncbi:zinc finger CCCH domain-containing protein 67 [Scenedesmus sp. PABB004]|nr:zinc finger CCCH domain-containing protein 67 [Scenedesmus sp. PABB004]